MTLELRYMPCAEFELSVHAYVDGELPTADTRALLVHLELCDGCRDAIEAVRRQIRAHQDARTIEGRGDAAERGRVFQRVGRRLVDGNVERLSTLLYELGKAYFLAGNDSRLAAFLLKKSVGIDRAQAEGRRLVKETLELAEKTAGAPPRTAQRLAKASQMFRGKATATKPARKGARIGLRSGRTALDNARRFLEECLVLAPGHAAARLYLGVYFHRIDRPDEAIAEYEKVLAIPGLDAGMRVMALQALGNAYAYRRDYDRAIPYYEEIRRVPRAGEDSRFFSALISLAIGYAKVGRLEASAEAFGEVVARHPQRLAEAKQMLDQAEVFHTLLRSQARFRDELATRYPVLFAS